MTNERAKEILQCMADGIDPVTGEILEVDHSFNSPEVIRALYTAIQALSASKPEKTVQAASKKEKLNAGRPWTEEELDALDRMYREGEAMDVICKKLQRKVRGVQKQLAYLGLIESAKKPSRAPVPGLERAGLPWTRAEDVLLKNLHKQRLPIAEIAARMQRSPYSIFCRMEKMDLYGEAYGYPPLDELPKWSNADNVKLREKFNEGISIEELAAYFGRPEKSIHARLFYMGLIKESPLPALRQKS